MTLPDRVNADRQLGDFMHELHRDVFAWTTREGDSEPVHGLVRTLTAAEGIQSDERMCHASGIGGQLDEFCQK